MADREQIEFEIHIDVIRSSINVMDEPSSIVFERSPIVDWKGRDSGIIELNYLHDNLVAANNINGACQAKLYKQDHQLLYTTNEPFYLYLHPYYRPMEGDIVSIIDATGYTNADIDLADYYIGIFNMHLYDNTWLPYSIIKEGTTDRTYIKDTTSITIDSFDDIVGALTDITYDQLNMNALFLGTATGGSCSFQIPYKPLTNCFVYTYEVSSGTITTWTVTDYLNPNHDETGTICALDPYEGKIYFSYEVYSDMYLLNPINAIETELEVYPFPGLDELPLTGHLTIGAETMEYIHRDFNKFYVIRSAGAIHVADVLVTKSTSTAPGEGDEVFVLPILGLFLNLNLIERINSLIDLEKRNGLIVNSINDRQPSTIELSINAERKITEYVFGYLEIGNGLKQNILTALVKDQYDAFLEHCLITFHVSDLAYLGLNRQELSKYSNAVGEASAAVSIPYSDQYGEYITAITFDGTYTQIEMTEDFHFAEMNDFLLYQVIKSDPLVGTKGIHYDVDTYVEPGDYGAASKVTLTIPIVEQNREAFIQFYDGATLYTIDVVRLESLTIHLKETLTITPTEIWLFYADDIEWDSSTLNGTKVLIYEDNGAGAYVPVRPHHVIMNTLYYEGEFPDPLPDDRGSNLGAYFVVHPFMVEAYADTTDTYNFVITSNYLMIVSKLDTNFFIGYDDIPEGMKLYDIDENIGTTLSNGNFLTVNTEGGLYGLRARVLTI